jgi:hypothetical protein
MAALSTASFVLAAPAADFSIIAGAKFTVNQTNNPKYTGPEPFASNGKNVYQIQEDCSSAIEKCYS